jgi:hypothetical protein
MDSTILVFNKPGFNTTCFQHPWFQQSLISTILVFNNPCFQQSLISTILDFNNPCFQQSLFSTHPPVHFNLPLLSFYLYTTFKSGIGAACESIPLELRRFGEYLHHLLRIRSILRKSEPDRSSGSALSALVTKLAFSVSIGWQPIVGGPPPDFVQNFHESGGVGGGGGGMGP